MQLIASKYPQYKLIYSWYKHDHNIYLITYKTYSYDKDTWD